jgi:predicted ATPase/class 3 adenylate cyclase
MHSVQPLVPPSGTVTFVFTGIEGSAQRWDRDRAAMEDAMQRHDAVLRSAFADHRGHIFKTLGDAFCAAFERPEDAVAAALAAQTAIATTDFSAIGGIHVRIAIHTGTADERDGDYFGPALNRVARLLAICNGDQVLISGITADLVRDALPHETTLRDLGDHRLRDLSRLEHVFQLVAPGLRDAFPALRSLSVLPNNLPRLLNAFVGREREIEEITALIEAHPLVTLVGSGGLGKTRTSLQVAAQIHDGWVDGVWFIELAPLTSGDYITSSIAHALDLTLPSDGNPLENLVLALNAKHLLLLFDNCEHLITPVARIISTLLRECPQLSILASSRQALGVAGEVTYRMPALGLPDAAHAATLTAADASQYAAISLFVERTQAADQRFTLTDENAPIIADICRRLDGIALAIELAAARVRLLTPQQLRDRLNERFRVLTGGSRDVLPRQQTLRALIDWSYDLLDERERILFRRLGIFVNGFTLEAAAAVASSDDLDELDVFELLESLVDKSLVLAEANGDSQRYRLLESTRAYAIEKLDAAGERDRLAGRHLAYVRDRFAELADEEARTARQTALSATFAAELEDVRAALDWALANGQVVAGAHVLAHIRRTWSDLCLENECIAWHESYLAALPPDASSLLAQLAVTLAMVFGNLGQLVRWQELTTRAVAYARAGDDPTALVRALTSSAWVDMRDHRAAEADRSLTEAEALVTTNVSDRLKLLEARGLLSYFQADYDTAVRVFADLQREQKALGNMREVQRAAMNLANAEHVRGETRRAIAVARDILPKMRRRTDRSLRIFVLCNLACALVAVDDLLGATDTAREAMALLAAEQPTHPCVSLVIEVMALVHAIIGDLERAALLLGYSDAALQAIGFTREVGEQRGYDRLMTLLQAGLTADTVERCIREGRLLGSEAAIALASEEEIVHEGPPRSD